MKLNPLVRSLHRPIRPRQGEEDDREENALRGTRANKLSL